MSLFLNYFLMQFFKRNVCVHSWRSEDKWILFIQLCESLGQTQDLETRAFSY